MSKMKLLKFDIKLKHFTQYPGAYSDYLKNFSILICTN